MAVEGRTYRPVVDHKRCGTCVLCLGLCPADVLPGTRAGSEDRIYGPSDTGPKVESSATPEPPCRTACPIGQDVRGTMRLIYKGFHREALALIREANPLPSVCGYVCHHPCENACERGFLDAPLSIRSLKRFAADYDDGSLNSPPAPGRTNRKVAVIGSGPAGLTAACDLAAMGYAVEVFESYRAPGGMLAWAIPDFRLPRDALTRDIAYVEKMGVKIRTGVFFGRDMNIQDLRVHGAHAVIIATGTQKSLKMNLSGELVLEGVFDCLTFLRRYNENDLPPLGEHAIVVGGGNAAIDTARAAMRRGGKATLIYRRSLEEMPADRDELNEALREGMEIMFRTAPSGILAERGRITALVCVKTEPTEGSARGRPKPVEGSEFEIPADTLISAVGQESEYAAICRGMCLEGKEPGIDPKTMRTRSDDVFAAGDFLNGPTTVVEAMASGRKAARAVDAYLSGSCR